MASGASGPDSLDVSSRLPARGGASRIRRFNGLSKRTSDWDGLKRDSQLWFNDADCTVHFSAYRASQRGPSLKIPYTAVKELNSEYLIGQCLRKHSRLSPIPSEDGQSDSGYGSELEKIQYELYIPAPAGLSKDQAFGYHLTTRNVLAAAVGKPLVGERLSVALSGLWQRIQDWRCKDGSLEFFISYCKEQGYLNFIENSEHALAFLKFAEDARIRNFWVDAFVHCVGMHQRLDLSPEFRGLSRTTTALITRASLEMDLHIARIVRALGGFLEEELSGEHLGLTKNARDHLDRFRSFLTAYYVDKMGYFPPKQTNSWNKRLWSRVHHDFQSLYDYLVDTESTSDLNGNRGVNGGVCVVQNLNAFDERHGYEPLSHPLPLLPETPLRPKRGVSSQRGLRSFSLGVSQSSSDLRSTAKQVLEQATNTPEDPSACDLVQEYQRFERQRLEEKIDVSEARKVRWILVYTSLQMLNSITGAPKEVRDTTAAYPLCSLITGCPPWKDANTQRDSAIETGSAPRCSARSSLVPDVMDASHSRSPSRFSIHPDCEADNAEQFFASNGISRQPSQADIDMTPSPLRVNTNLSRRNSLVNGMHSSVNALHKLGSKTRRNSMRRNSLVQESKWTPTEPKRMPSFCEIVVDGYGNGLGQTYQLDDKPYDYEGESQSAVESTPVEGNAFALFDFGLPAANDEPTVEDHQLIGRRDDEVFHVDHPELVDSSPRDSHASVESVDFDLYRVPSLESSNEHDTPDTDVASWADEYSRRNSKMSAISAISDEHTVASSPSKVKLHSYVPTKHDTGSKTSVNAGCYTPSGMMKIVGPPRSPFSHPSRVASTESLVSDSSSVYLEGATQAADIEDEDSRGRRRSRALDEFKRFGVAAKSGFVS